MKFLLYHDVLGFEIEYTEGMNHVYLEKDGILFLMYRRSDFETDQTFERVVSMGAKPVLSPETEEWGQRTCYVADPERNLIEIGSFGKEREYGS
ncbi:MAG: hypothetical protein J5979_00760 [Lachnospiraceae bacterium]|nr:hypothetical protein [Lachnospiraceae bacterium]